MNDLALFSAVGLVLLALLWLFTRPAKPDLTLVRGQEQKPIELPPLKRPENLR